MTLKNQKSELISTDILNGNKILATFQYKPSDLEILPHIKQFKKHYKRLHDFFGVTPPPIEIRFIYTRAEMSHHWNRRAPRWLAGMVDNNNQYLTYIYSPMVIEKLTEQKKDFVFTAVIHETAHTFVAKINKRCFYWINEGVCQVLQGKQLSESPIKTKHWQWFIKRNALVDPDLSWIETVNHDGYEIAHQLTAYILKKLGKKAVIDLIKIRRSPNSKITQKMEKIFGESIESFLDGFKQRAKLRA